MRFFFLIISLFHSIPLFADCYTADIDPFGPYDCNSGTLYINSTLQRRNPDISSNLAPLTIIADNIVIEADIVMNGADGATSFTGTDEGGAHGYGGTPGGSVLSGVPTSGGIEGPEDGKLGTDEPGSECASGAGGGGSFSSPGQPGTVCRISSTISGTALAGAGGSQAPLSFIGGFGGGAGGTVGSLNSGLGGGGAGAIKIETRAGGTITIANGVRITARGGRGGNSASIGGAGGGGGGGYILLKATTINNQGILDVRGGDGGTSTLVTFPRGGDGGRGGDGIFIIEENSVQTTGTGIQDFSTGLPTTSRSSLKSDISCGTLAKKNENTMLFQIMAGFLLAFAISFSMRQRQSLFGCIRTLFQSRM